MCHKLAESKKTSHTRTCNTVPGTKAESSCKRENSKRPPRRKGNSFFFQLWNLINNKSGSEKAWRPPAPRATAVLETFRIHSPLCHSKISLFNIQADLQIAFLYESLSLWLRPLNTFIRAEDSFANETPEKCSPAPQRDRMPSHCSRSMGAAGIVGTAWPCSSRSTQSRSCLIQGLSPSMFLRSETSDNTKLPWQ